MPMRARGCTLKMQYTENGGRPTDTDGEIWQTRNNASLQSIQAETYGNAVATEKHTVRNSYGNTIQTDH